MSNYGSIREYKDDPDQKDYRDDNGGSVTEIAEQISNNIFQINGGANSLERALKNIGTDKDSPQLRDNIHGISQKVSKIVQSTTHLHREALGKRADKQQKIQLNRLKGQFQEAVQRFQTLQKKAFNKVKTSVTLGGHGGQSNLASLEGDDDNVGSTASLLEERQQRAQILKEHEEVIEDDLALIREREERIHQLEADILDVNEIFKELGALVSAQGQVLDTIDSNVERAAVQVEGGNEQLIKAANYQRKSRKKMCCLLIILLIVAIIITIIIVVAVKA